jgi:hypothetical protein
VRSGSLEDVLAAARLNTLVWGGRSNPIVPVGEDPAASAALVRDLRADVIHVITPNDAITETVARLPYLRRPRGAIGGSFELVGDDELGIVSIRLLVRHYHELVFRHTRDPSTAVLPTWAADAELHGLFTILFGEYPEGPPGPRCRRAFVEGLRGEVVDFTKLPVDLTAGRITPLEFTLDQLESDRVVHGHGIVLADPTDADELAWFWNLRAAGAAVTLVPSRHDDAGIDRYTSHHLERLAPAGLEDDRRDLYCWQAGGWSSEPQQDLPPAVQTDIERLALKPVFATLTPDSWYSVSRGSPIWRTSARATLATVEDERDGRKKLVFALPPSPYNSAPVSGMWRTRWLTTVDTYSEYDYPGHTLRIPDIPELATWASDAMRYADDVRVTGHGIDAFCDARDTSLELRLVDEPDVVQQVLATAGLRARTSPAGEAARRIVTQLGGLHGCRPLRLPGLRKVLINPDRAHTWNEALRLIHDGGSFARYRNVSSAAEVFTGLLKKGVFHAGLHVPCPECSVTSRYVADALGARLECPRCGSAFLLAPELSRANWRYQPSGFFAIHRQHGSIPVILTLMRLHHHASERALFLCPPQELSGDGLDCEVDVVALAQDREGQPTLAVGECKGGSEPITESDVTDILAVASRLEDSGLQCFPLFSTTRDRFTETEIELFKRALSRPAPSGVEFAPALLFNLHDLQSWEPFPRALAELLPVRYPHSLADFARNSVARHLRGIGADVQEAEELLI